jgi:alcohol dehydrogenase (cytochrome c)/quinohemoprotein ethanol dehydrogenase
VDASRITAADQDPANWMTYGRTYSEQRFSPARITADNVKQLGLTWYADLDINRGQEATPLVIDGVLYVSTAWSMVKAFDAKTDTLLWSYDPAVPRELGVKGCCDVVNRGVAAWKGKIVARQLSRALERRRTDYRWRPCGPRQRGRRF